MLRPLVFVCIVGLSLAEKVSYEGHKVYRVTPTNATQFGYVQKFQRYLESKRVDIWHQSIGPDSNLDFRLGPDMGAILENLHLKYNVIIPDVQAYDNAVMKANREAKSDAGFDYGKYHQLEEIMNWMDSMVSQYSNIASMFPIAMSFEKRTLNGIKIATNPSASKPAIWLEGGIHAREWISPATVVYMTNSLLSQYEKDQDITTLLNTFDVYIVPVVNVDGYKYTWTTDRMWRKTRSTHSGTTCVGVDPNRNWNFHWCGKGGASKDPCSDSYCGPSPFSENVVRGIAESINMTGNFVGFIDFHSYSQLWMTPWGYTKQLPVDFQQQNASSAAAIEALGSVFGTKYKCGSIANIIYVATGSSADWTYGVAKVKYSVGVELRDTGKYGFLLPPDQIIPSGQETLVGVLAWMNFIKNNM